MAQKRNTQLISAAAAKAVSIMLNEKGIGGGVTKIYEPDGSIFGPTVDLTDPEAKSFLFEFANTATGVQAGEVLQQIVNNPVRWVEMLAEQIKREGETRHPDV
jgi:hypothetical protein